MTSIQPRWLLVITAFVVLSDCQNTSDKKNVLAFRPLLNKPYQFSVTRSSTKSWTYQDSLNDRSDTTRVTFTLKNIKTNDSSYFCTLSFDQYKVKMPEVRVTLLNVDLSKQLFIDNTFSLLDSIGYYIKGLPLHVEMSKKGMVNKVDSIPQILAVMAARSHRDYVSVKSLLQDYISVNAIKDLLNQTLAISPGKAIVPGFRWATTLTMVTKAPFDIQTFYVPVEHSGDSLNINTSLLIDPGDSSDVLKGNGKGSLIMSYSNGMPYVSESTAETVTTASDYNITEKVHYRVEQLIN